MIPVSPAMRNWNRNAVQKSIGALNWIFPPHIVASQLKILIPVGTAMAIVVKTKKVLAVELIPTVNMWCAHTLMLMNPMATVAATITGYPKIALRENTGMISDAIANAGMTSTYTSGWPKIQKKCIQMTADPPACVSKKCAPR